jgi:hypothetical protein
LIQFGQRSDPEAVKIGRNSVSEIRDLVLPGSIFPDPGSLIPDPRGMFFGEIFLRILVL